MIRSFTGSAGSVDPGKIPELEPGPRLSEGAHELLLEAIQDNNGVIISIPTMGGRLIQTNNRSFVEPRNPRSEARWKGAVDELNQLHLIEDRGHKGEVFFVTDEGYRAADHSRK